MGLEHTVARLRAITGEDKASWRIHEARRLLAFNPTEESTALAIQLLNQARLTSWPNPTISDLLADAHLRDPTDPASVYDELLVVRPPKRLVGGVLVRF